VWQRSTNFGKWALVLHLCSGVYIVMNLYTTIGPAAMRTNIEIDDELLSQAMTATGLATKRATVEEGLRLLVRLRKQAKALTELKGMGWEGDLGEMRQGRPPRRS
jgi:Arc/MetJ family transcription regulator